MDKSKKMKLKEISITEASRQWWRMFFGKKVYVKISRTVYSMESLSEDKKTVSFYYDTKSVPYRIPSIHVKFYVEDKNRKTTTNKNKTK